jgi:hypothetical protein
MSLYSTTTTEANIAGGAKCSMFKGTVHSCSHYFWRYFKIKFSSNVISGNFFFKEIV